LMIWQGSSGGTVTMVKVHRCEKSHLQAFSKYYFACHEPVSVPQHQ
jgi:hypothetical protein